MDFVCHLLNNPTFQSTVFVITLIALIALTTFLYLKIKIHKNIKLRPLPPGPAPWPFVGNLPEMWRNRPAFKWIHGLMEEMNTNISCIRLGNVHVIPVISPEIALEVLRDNDAVFASRPITVATELASRGFLSIILVPYGEQWKKMRKVVASQLLRSARLRSLLVKRREEADNLISFVYNQCKNSNTGSVVNVRLATRQYAGNVIRKMLFNRRYFGEGKEDGGPGLEEEEHVDSIFVILGKVYSFAVSDYLPWMRVFDLEGHEKIVSDAVRTISKYHDPIIDDRVRQWRYTEAKKEAEDMLDSFILAKDENGKPLLTVDEIKAQCVVRKKKSAINN